MSVAISVGCPVGGIAAISDTRVVAVAAAEGDAKTADVEAGPFPQPARFNTIAETIREKMVFFIRFGIMVIHSGEAVRGIFRA
jgi:hypothetical protein